MISIFTFDYNASELTVAFLKSVAKNRSLVSVAKDICIFSNGNVFFEPPANFDLPVRVIDVSSRKNFNKPKPDNQHSFCIQTAIEIAKNDDILICDCDILLKPDSDITELVDQRFVTVGQLIRYPNAALNRIHPCLQYLNRKMINETRITFYNGHTYATGDSFYKQVLAKLLPVRYVKVEDYCHHLRISTYDNKNAESHFRKESHMEFLNQHKECWS